MGHGGGWLQSLHAVSFVVWGALIVVHAFAYLTRTLGLGTADWRRRVKPVIAGARARRTLLIGALLLGVILALAGYPVQHFQRHGEARAQAPAVR